VTKHPFDWSTEEADAYRVGVRELDHAIRRVLRTTNERAAMSSALRNKGPIDMSDPLAAMQADADNITSRRYAAQAEGMTLAVNMIYADVRSTQSVAQIRTGKAYVSNRDLGDEQEETRVDNAGVWRSLRRALLISIGLCGFFALGLMILDSARVA
jgi:hypothetical protein